MIVGPVGLQSFDRFIIGVALIGPWTLLVVIDRLLRRTR
jgi:hypothetical protein